MNQALATSDKGQSPQKKHLVPSIVILSICILAILIAMLLTPTAPGASLTFAGIELPPTCTSVRDFGVACPGCGLTRSWVSAVHGRLAESVAHHRLGWLVLIYACLQILRHSLLLAKPHWQMAINSKFGKLLDRGIILLAILLFLNWLPYLWQEILLPMW